MPAVPAVPPGMVAAPMPVSLAPNGIHLGSRPVLVPVYNPARGVVTVLRHKDTGLRDPFWSWLRKASSHACKTAVSGVCGKDQTDKRDPILPWLAGMAAKTVGCSLVVSFSIRYLSKVDS